MMENKTLVSVIIPTHNRANLIERAINSVLSQTYKNIELIVVNDGSTDQTEKIILEKYPSIRYFNQENQGVSAARNVGVKNSTGNYIAFLDSDDEWLPEKIKKQMEKILNSTERWVHGEERWIRRGVRVNPKKIHQKSGGDIFLAALNLCLISPSTVLMEKKLFDEFGGFDPEFIVCEDFDLWLRILTKNPIAFIEDEMIIKYGGHEDQLSARYKAMDYFRILTYQKLLENFSLGELRNLEILTVAQKKCEILINGFEKHGRLEESLKIKNLLSSVFGGN